jgi:hypothetical protein
MNKETFYFSHDYNTRSDDKIKKLIRTHGMMGYGVFWSIVEDLYNNANALRTDYDGIAYDLRVDVLLVKSIINDFDLFSIEEEFFGSKSIESRLDRRNEKSLKARESAFKRWNKNANASNVNANALRPECDGNAIKDSIVKERKGKDIKILSDKPTDFIDQIVETFVKEHGSYEVITPGKEREMAGKLLKIYKSKYPDSSSEETIEGLRGYFNLCVNINDQWLRDNMSLSTIISKFNTINKILKNGNSTGKQQGATTAGIARAIAKNFASDFRVSEEKH